MTNSSCDARAARSSANAETTRHKELQDSPSDTEVYRSVGGSEIYRARGLVQEAIKGAFIRCEVKWKGPRVPIMKANMYAVAKPMHTRATLGLRGHHSKAPPAVGITCSTRHLIRVHSIYTVSLLHPSSSRTPSCTGLKSTGVARRKTLQYLITIRCKHYYIRRRERLHVKERRT